MNRREVIKSMGMLSSHALFPAILSGFVSASANPAAEKGKYAPDFFDVQEFDLIRDVIDIILPETGTRSASQVYVHHFLDEVFAKCLTLEQKTLMKTGLSGLLKDFSSSTNKRELLTTLDRKAFQGDEDSAYFRTVKQYTLVGFFTSKEGMEKASNYVKVPGDYKGEIPVDEHTLNYGKTNLHYYL